jgi:uncharacterized protein YjbI with pentapeptide repeats
MDPRRRRQQIHSGHGRLRSAGGRSDQRRRLALVAVFSLIGVAAFGVGRSGAQVNDKQLDPCDAPTPDKLVEGKALAGTMLAGQPVTLAGMCVTGEVDLRGVQGVPRVVRCRNCTFEGAFIAPDVVFGQALDLAGATLQKEFDLSGATLKDRASFRDTKFYGPVDLSFSRLEGDADFTSAQFQPLKPGPTSLNAGAPDIAIQEACGPDPGPNSLKFLGLRVNGSASFVGTEFRSEADFTSAYLSGGADFSQAKFQCAFFRSSRFSGPVNMRFVESNSTLWLNRISVSGPMDLEGAKIQGSLSLQQSHGTSSLNLHDIKVGRGKLLVSGLSFGALTMDSSAAERSIQSGLGEFLDQLESSAKARGDLRSANDARYTRLSLDNNDRRKCFEDADANACDAFKGRTVDDLHKDYLLDRYLYRDLAGYLVKPLVPLGALLKLLLLAGLLRGLATLVLSLSRRLRKSPDKPPKLRSRLAGALATALVHPSRLILPFFDGVTGACSSAFHRKSDITIENRSRLRQYLLAALKWGEFLAYKVLLAVVILSFGNSNATIRQLLDAVRS